MIKNSYSQELEIITTNKNKVKTLILDSLATSKILTEFNAKQNDSLRKKWTSRTHTLSDGRIIIEFYDKQSVLINSIQDFQKLEQIRFTKNTIDFLKKNISYKIEIGFETGKHLVENEKPEHLGQFVSDLPEYFDFKVYQLKNKQILFLDKSKNFKNAIIYPNLKTLCSDNISIQEQYYYSEDEEYLMKRLASGDRLDDYQYNDHVIYPKYLSELIINHKLMLIEEKVYVSNFHGNLYKSDRGYYVLIDEVNQKNGAGKKMSIVEIRFYETLEQVRNAESNYQNFKNKGVTSEHFYQKLSDSYGKEFPEFVPKLIEGIPKLLNLDNQHLTFDEQGMDLIDEALKWNGNEYDFFDKWFPSILAYYGECYKRNKNDGEWKMTYEEESQVWIPELILNNGKSAWDWRRIYKSLFEGPIPMRWAGNWDNLRI